MTNTPSVVAPADMSLVVAINSKATESMNISKAMDKRLR